MEWGGRKNIATEERLKERKCVMARQQRE